MKSWCLINIILFISVSDSDSASIISLMFHNLWINGLIVAALIVILHVCPKNMKKQMTETKAHCSHVYIFFVCVIVSIFTLLCYFCLAQHAGSN